MTRWSRWRKRTLACALALVGAWSSGACGLSENDEAGDDAGGGSTASGGTGGPRGGSGGTSGVAGSYCDGYQCLNGIVALGPCIANAFISCDRAISGVDCVTSGVCPILGTGGAGGVSGASGAGGTSGAGTSGAGSGGRTGGTGGVCDALHCTNGVLGLGPCPGTAFTRCNRADSGVDCVVSGVCPSLGGAGGETGGSGEGGGG